MELSTILISSAWAGLFASGWAVLLTAPARFIAAAFVGGFAARFARDALTSWGLSQNWSTAFAAAIVVLIAVAITRRNAVSPVVLVTGVLPLGAVVAMFYTIILLMKVSFLTGEALNGAVVELSANLGKAFTTTLAIALGLGAGLGIARFSWREDSQEG